MSQNQNSASVAHPYREGYSVLPKLRRIPQADLFHFDPDHYQRCLVEKQLAMNSQIVEVEHNLSDELRSAVSTFLIQNYPIPLKPAESLAGLAVQMQEDFIIHALQGAEDWMAYGHVCLPSSWSPEEKIGRCLRDLHSPIPGMNLDNSLKLVESMVWHGPFERFIWSVVFEDKLNFHPNQAHAGFNPERPQVYVKVERQVTVGFPEQQGALFLLCETVLEESQIDRPALVNAISVMSPEELAYKGLVDCKAGLLAWLSRKIR